MDTILHIPKTKLARQARQVIQAVQRGQIMVVEHYGQPEAAIIDIMDYYLLRAVLHYHTHSSPIDAEAGLPDESVATLESLQEQVNLVMAHYLAKAISLSRAAELLNLTWLDLRTRCLRLDIPLRTAPATTGELAIETETASLFTTPLP